MCMEGVAVLLCVLYPPAKDGVFTMAVADYASYSSCVDVITAEVCVFFCMKNRYLCCVIPFFVLLYVLFRSSFAYTTFEHTISGTSVVT